MKLGEAVIAVVTAEEGDSPNRALCRRRNSHRAGRVRCRLSPMQPCLEGWCQNKNAESAA